jgi:hypothetical protein
MRPTPGNLSNSLDAMPEVWDTPPPPTVAELRSPPLLSWRNSPLGHPLPQAVLPRPAV